MNRQTVQPGQIAAASVAIGGALIMAFPQHLLSIVQLVLVTLAAAAGLHALNVLAPASWWTSPFDGMDRPPRTNRPHDELNFTRSTFSARRQPMQYGPALPPATLRLLKPLISVALSREHLDPTIASHRERARSRLSPQTWAVWTSKPILVAGWWATRRPDPHEVAQAVNQVLDDLDRLARNESLPSAQPEPTVHE